MKDINLFSFLLMMCVLVGTKHSISTNYPKCGYIRFESNVDRYQDNGLSSGRCKN